MFVTLPNAGHKVVETREPGGTATGERIRKVLLDSGTAGLSPLAEMALMFASVVAHAKRGGKSIHGWPRACNLSPNRAFVYKEATHEDEGTVGIHCGTVSGLRPRGCGAVTELTVEHHG